MCFFVAPLTVLALAVFASSLAAGDGGAVSKASPPNVLFLAVDDMKDWVNCLGGYEGTVYTPNIDRLAKRGMLFTNAHCPSPKCAPSRAAIMTGLRPSSTGLYDNGHWWLPNLPNVVTIPAHFRNHGYRAVGAGKIFHHTAGNNPPIQWDDFYRLTFRCDPWFRGAKLNYPWTNVRPYPKGFPFSGVEGLGHENDWGALDISDGEYDDTLCADYAIRFIKQNQKRPFFLACGLFRPHLPWYVPQRFFDRYPLDDLHLPECQENDLDDVPAEGQKLARARRSDWETIRAARRWPHAVRAYLASISYADDQLGRVLDALDASPHANNTVTVLWSDHGWHLGEKGHWHKSTLWEESTRVPLVIRAPGHPSGVCRRPVSLLDLFPTLNELCGTTNPPGSKNEPTAGRGKSSGRHVENLSQGEHQPLDGVSLVPLLSKPRATWNRPAVIEFRQGNAAVRSDHYRYIRYHDGGEELYDLRTDPREWHNLASSDQHAAIKTELAGWIAKQWADPAPTKSAFHFDPHLFTWKHKETGKMTQGQRQ